jgi:hypothetical protein
VSQGGAEMKKEFDFFDKPKNIKMMRRIFYTTLVVLVALDLFISKHPEFPMEKIPGFYALYGFIACVLIVAVSKTLGLLLKKKGDYYD